MGFLHKYFTYRERYVAYVDERAPRWAKWAIASELARLTFTFVGSSMCALLFWLLVAAAFPQLMTRSGLIALFALCAFFSTWFAGLALAGALKAARMLRSGSVKVMQSNVNRISVSAED